MLAWHASQLPAGCSSAFNPTWAACCVGNVASLVPPEQLQALVEQVRALGLGAARLCWVAATCVVELRRRISGVGCLAAQGRPERPALGFASAWALWRDWSSTTGQERCLAGPVASACAVCALAAAADAQVLQSSAEDAAAVTAVAAAAAAGAGAAGSGSAGKAPLAVQEAAHAWMRRLLRSAARGGVAGGGGGASGAHQPV